MTDMSNTTGRTDAVRDGRHLMENDYEEILVRPDGVPFYNMRRGLIARLPVSLMRGSVHTGNITKGARGLWGDPSMFDAPEHPNYRYGPTVTT
jgi:hypothetical protein